MTSMSPGSSPLRPKHRHSASFSMSNKILRTVWRLTWLALARPTPAPLHGWRRIVLRAFGAKIGRNVRIYPSSRIWLPANLCVGDDSIIGPGVECYNQGYITIGKRVVVSQRATLCASTHDIDDSLFPLILRPIMIGDDTWVAAEAFVGPGGTIGEGSVLGARAVAMTSLPSWQLFSGNPAVFLRNRKTSFE